MKRIGGLFPHIVSWDNLGHALRKALIGKRNREDAAAFVEAMPGSLNEIGDRLRSGSGPIGGFTEFVIHDPKERGSEEQARRHAGSEENLKFESRNSATFGIRQFEIQETIVIRISNFEFSLDVALLG